MIIEEFKKRNNIISRSREINELVDVIMQVAKSDITVLIYGESGVGKEIFARAIHNESNRYDKPLINVNSGAIPEGILESELFGHRKGSFTGAIDHRKGYFEMAEGGTLFFDEIAEMPLTTQVKLLRVIESKELTRVGAEIVTSVNVRVIAATNKDLQRAVDERRFRQDLYFRLKVVTIHIPPLRNRRDDIELLTDHFIKNYAKENHITPPLITDKAIEMLRDFNWPGNIRELKNTVETAIALNKTGVLNEDSFISLVENNSKFNDQRNLPVYLRKTPEEADREILYRALFEIKKDLIDLKDLIIYQQRDAASSTSAKSQNEVIPLNEMEKEAIINALEQTRGSKRKAAKLLNISERTLYRKIKEYQIL
jgi:transcriptional regulator with GAF, ATPase, and Fis domain